MARGGARSLQQAILVLLIIGLLVGLGFGTWSLRPIPDYTSGDVTVGSPFDVAFRIENKNPWFAMTNLKISCVVAHVRASGMEPTMIGATDMRFPLTGGSGLEPGEAATFTCPFRTLIGHPVNDDPGVAQRSEIYFRATYDLPVLGTFRITVSSVPFFLNTRLLPPRWTGKPAG